MEQENRGNRVENLSFLILCFLCFLLFDFLATCHHSAKCLLNVISSPLPGSRVSFRRRLWRGRGAWCAILRGSRRLILDETPQLVDLLHRCLRLLILGILGGLLQQWESALGFGSELSDTPHSTISSVRVRVFEKGFHQGWDHRFRARSDCPQRDRRVDADAVVLFAAKFLNEHRDGSLSPGSNIEEGQSRLKANVAVIISLEELHQIRDSWLGDWTGFGQGCGGISTDMNIRISQSRR